MKTLHKEENAGVTYSRSDYMHGGGWHSRERGVNPGTVRVINGLLSKAWTVRKRGFLKPEVHWVAVKPTELRDVGISERPENVV